MIYGCFNYYKGKRIFPSFILNRISIVSFKTNLFTHVSFNLLGIIYYYINNQWITYKKCNK